MSIILSRRNERFNEGGELIGGEVFGEELVFESRVGDPLEGSEHGSSIDDSGPFGKEGEEGVGEAKGTKVVDVVGVSGLDSERFGGCSFVGKAKGTGMLEKKKRN